MKNSTKGQEWRCIGQAASMYQIRKYNKIKKGAITMIDRLDKFPQPYDVVLVNDKRAFKTVQYLFIDNEHGFKRLEGAHTKVSLATVNKGN